MSREQMSKVVVNGGSVIHFVNSFYPNSNSKYAPKRLACQPEHPVNVRRATIQERKALPPCPRCVEELDLNDSANWMMS